MTKRAAFRIADIRRMERALPYGRYEIEVTPDGTIRAVPAAAPRTLKKPLPPPVAHA